MVPVMVAMVTDCHDFPFTHNKKKLKKFGNFHLQRKGGIVRTLPPSVLLFFNFVTVHGPPSE